MEKPKADTRSKPEKTKALIKNVYEPSTVQLFWDGTSEKVERTVNAAANESQTKLLAKKVSRKLSREEKKYLNGSSAGELEEMLQTYLDRASERQTADATRPGKFNRAERKTTKFLNNFHSYVEAYSGIIQLMNGAPGGGGYGDAAYGALSLFLMVGVNKARTEELMDQMMHQLHQSYCRIKMVEGIYNTDRIKELTAKVYRLGIEFLYTAIRYYSMNTFRKMWHVVARPPSVQLNNKIVEIQDAIEDMRQEMRTLDAIRLEKIETDLGRTAAQVFQTAKDVEVMRAQADQKHLEHLKSLLSIDMDKVDPSLTIYSELLEERFNGRHVAALNVEEALYQNPNFRSWQKSDQTNLLVLRDSTHALGMSDLSWVSPGPVRIVQDIDELFPEDAPLLLRHFCRFIDDWSSRDTKIEAQSILRSLIYQILRDRRCDCLLRNDDIYIQTKRDIEHVNTVDVERPSEIVKHLFHILGDIVETVPVERLLIVVDRLDEVIGSLDVFFEHLLDLIAKQHGKVKVLLTLGRQRSLEEARIGRVLGEEGYKIMDFDPRD